MILALMNAPLETGDDFFTIPRRALANGAQIPVVGMGTFGSDKYSAETVASAVVEAASRQIIKTGDAERSQT